MLTVLLIDDQNPLLEVMHPLLERIGHMKVKTALSAKEALDLLVSTTFDAMIVDYDLPEINGIEFLKIIRAKGDTTPIIIFTGVGREFAAIEALNFGADFFLKKGDDVQAQLLEMVQMIHQAVDRRNMGKAPGTVQKILSEAFNFFDQPAYVIDREGKVIVWNKGITGLTGIKPGEIIGKGDWEYSIPFFGHKTPMLSDLIFQDDAAVLEHKYRIIEREKGTVTAWIKATPEEGRQTVLWMQSTALYDSKGVFIGIMGKVRDVTEEMGAELLNKPVPAAHDVKPSEPAVAGKAGIFDKILGKAKTLHREGLRLSFREAKYLEAIPYFDQALEIDSSLPYVWHDRGVCFREIGKDMEALRNFNKAVELAPHDEELIFSRAEMLKTIGILRHRQDFIEMAIQNLNLLLEKNPNHAEAWNCLGIWSKEIGKDALSRQYYEKSRELIRQGKNKKKTRNLDLIT
jgi:DNA-binding response OmpR family regulator